MSEGVLAVVKQEMKSYIWLQTTDGSVQQVEEDVAMFCPVICRQILEKNKGSSKSYPVSLPERVNPASLGLILDYCRFHQVPGRSNKERKLYDEKFTKMDTQRLCELTSAAYSLKLRPLVDLTCRALARIIEGRSPEEIRDIFHLPDDLTEEEKLEPLRNFIDDPRIRRLNRLYAKKRKELKERDKLKDVEVEEEHGDERSVDDLLSFINGGGKDSKRGRASNKNKKKNRRRKEQANPLNDSNNGSIDRTLSPTPSQTSNLLDLDDFEFDDSDDDGLDPALKEQIDREVEDFARRLNSNFPEWMQEILSLSNERRHVPISGNINGSLSSFPRSTTTA